MVFPNFLIIGAQKAATSTLFSMLHGHEEVFIPPQKELSFFTIEGNYRRGPRYYASFFRDAGERKAVGEATPDYLHKKEAPERIHRLIPNVRLICSLRDPIDRAYSAFLMQVSKGSEPIWKSFQQAIIDTQSYVEYGMYATQLERYMKFFPRSSIQIFLLEDIQKRPQWVYDETCAFLGIRQRALPEGGQQRKNVGGLPRSALIQSSVNMAYRWRNAMRETPIAPLVDYPFVDRWARRIRNRIANWNRDIEKYPSLDPRVRESLLPLFRVENDRLGKLLGRDLTHWNRV